jgi:hypothetical protein
VTKVAEEQFGFVVAHLVAAARERLARCAPAA